MKTTLRRRAGIFTPALVEARRDHLGTKVFTETRVQAVDAEARRKFARYWRVIRPSSAVIRRLWLRGIKRRAEE